METYRREGESCALRGIVVGDLVEFYVESLMPDLVVGGGAPGSGSPV